MFGIKKFVQILKFKICVGLLFHVDVHGVSVVGTDDQREKVRALVGGREVDVLLLEMVLTLVVQNDMNAVSAAALVRTKHNVVGGWVTESGHVIGLRTDLDVAATAFDFLVVLHLVLDDKVGLAVGERDELRGDAF